jgi:hypothetical protein
MTTQLKMRMTRTRRRVRVFVHTLSVVRRPEWQRMRISGRDRPLE